MSTPNSPYISRVKIRNFRNFENTEVELSHKQVIIGENNVGKTNFLRAIQLILDPSLSEEDRYLSETDFFDGLDDPMGNNEIIEIVLEIKGFEHNNAIVAELSDATVATVDADSATLRLTYRYEPSDNGRDYEYSIFQGTRPEIPFNHRHRKLINIKVISGLRDANSDLKNMKRSPLNTLLTQYNIDKEKLESIAGKMKEQSDDILNLDELIDLKDKVSSSMANTLGVQPYSRVSLETVDVNPLRVLNTLKLMIGEFKQRPTEETSLGLTNILYILLILISLEDRTISNLLKEDFYNQLLEEEDSDILTLSYTKTEQGNYKLNED